MSKLSFFNSVFDLLPCNIDEDVRYFIASLFCLESDFGNSNLAQSNHNYCGMKVPKVRPFLGYSLSDSSFAYYYDLSLCVWDFIICCMYHVSSRQFNMKVFWKVDEFKHFISLWYCPDKDYIHRIELIYNQYKPNV